MSLSQERKKKMKIAGKKLGIAASLFAASMMLCVAPAEAYKEVSIRNSR